MTETPQTVLEVLRGDFTRRCTAPELMDNPHSDQHRLERTLRQFAAINRVFSRYRTVLRSRLLGDAAAAGLRRISVLDVGGGGGDIARWLTAAAARAGAEAEVTILESDARVAAFARRACAAYPQITIEEGSALELGLNNASARYDYAICNHLLHHFSDQQLPALLRRMAAAARRRVIANDLLRHRPTAAAFALVASIFYPRSFAQLDGTLSIRKGFLPEELRTALLRAELADHAGVYTLAPGRIVLEIDTHSGSRV